MDAEDLGEGLLQPQPGRGAPEQVPVLDETPPDGAAVGLHRAAVAAGHAQLARGDALAEQHPGQVVVRHDEQLGRVGEGLVLGQQRRVDVPVRGDDGQLLHQRVQLPGQRALARFGGEEQVGSGRGGHGVRLLWSRSVEGE
ncbi:hypothetical protein Jiend_01970 [Micromonospora endophytica]|nr:hypothetical protein Jiend_01970 [Micromonospora endophytica]